MGFRAPTENCRFLLMHAAGLARGWREGRYSELDEGLVAALLAEAGRFGEEVLAPLNQSGDREGVRLDAGAVTTPRGWKDAYARWRDGGWNGMCAPVAHGGMGLPHVVQVACLDMWNAANMAFMLAPTLNFAAIDALVRHADEALKAQWLDAVVSGRWAATMALTEPQAGSDLANIAVRAEKKPDGSYGIRGQKIFISYGEHDLTDNVVHLVLARVAGAPAGTRGISLFLVPKFLPGPAGLRNDVCCIGVEHKLGLHAAPTCSMAFGEEAGSEGAVGWLVGEENQGLACMFTMMNAARLAVGVQGVGVGERAYQQAREFAQERRQGRAGEVYPAPILQHPDVRRMLLTMKALTQASRVLCYATAGWLDQAGDLAAARAALLTPVAKAFATDSAIETASLGIQLHGGLGYVEETGAAQHLRDARITAIYEGTNGIQAIDLLTRKLGAGRGEAFAAELAEMRDVVAGLRESVDLRCVALAEPLEVAVAALERAGGGLVGLLASAPGEALAGAGPFLRLFGLARGGAGLCALALVGTAADVELAGFFMENLACHCAGLAHEVLHGGVHVLASDAALGL